MITRQRRTTLSNRTSHPEMSRRRIMAGGASAAATLPIVLAAAGVPSAAAQPAAQGIGSPPTQPAFDPKNYPIVPPKRFEDLKVGDVFRAPGRTLTEALTSAFQAVSLDNNPRHYNEVYAKSIGLKAALIQPIQVLSFCVPGACLFSDYVETVLEAFSGLSCEFLIDSFVGDTLYPEMKIAELTPKDGKGYVVMAITVTNQRGEVVLSGRENYRLKLSPA